MGSDRHRLPRTRCEPSPRHHNVFYASYRAQPYSTQSCYISPVPPDRLTHLESYRTKGGLCGMVKVYSYRWAGLCSRVHRLATIFVLVVTRLSRRRTMDETGRYRQSAQSTDRSERRRHLLSGYGGGLVRWRREFA